MDYQGRAVVIDPDVFAVGDVQALLNRDMTGKAILAKPRPGYNGRPDYVATSVMLLDCAKLTHWNVRRSFEELFAFKRDYEDWITLAYEPPGTIGHLESEWNDFDRLTERTKLLHNTKRRSQPWKTGLPSDFTPRGTTLSSRAGIWLRRLRGKGAGRYRRHPDPAQERLFFRLLGECLDNGSVSTSLLETEIARGHIRTDAHDCIAQAQRAAA